MTRKPRTLRCRMLLIAAACVVATLAVAGASLVVLFEKHVLEAIGKDLDVSWAELARQVGTDPNGEPSLVERSPDSRFQRVSGGAYWQLSEDGAPLQNSPSLGGSTLNLSQQSPQGPQGTWFEITTPDGHELYVVERDIMVGPSGGQRRLQLSVALDHAQVEEARRGFAWDLVIVLGLIALVLVAGAWTQLYVILHPLKRLGIELGAIREGRQSRFQSEIPAEVAPLAEDLNRLLEGQDFLVKKARERAGALAHGLKTPLAILAAESRRLESDGHGDAAAKLREQLTTIQTHVERELARARAQGASAALGTLVDASRTADRLVRVMNRMPRGDALSWSHAVPENLTLRMDPDDFGEVLGNLLDNARKWAASRVTLGCEMVGASVRVIVEDDGPGFGANAAPTSLTAGDRENSAGLGLVIVQDILASYGSSLWIDRAADHGLVSFTLSGAVVAAEASAASGSRARTGGTAERLVPAIRPTH